MMRRVRTSERGDGVARAQAGVVDFLTKYTKLWDASGQGNTDVFPLRESITIGNLFSGLQRMSSSNFF